jgi:hypothetical protein
MSVILSDDVLTEGLCSTEKLCYRIRLAGGAARRSGEFIIPFLPQLHPLFSKALADIAKLSSGSSATSNSAGSSESELKVRKACCKLLKDTLKGLSSFYALNSVASPQLSSAVIGAPNNTANIQVKLS